jgi:hypothetical protein
LRNSASLDEISSVLPYRLPKAIKTLISGIQAGSAVMWVYVGGSLSLKGTCRSSC